MDDTFRVCSTQTLCYVETELYDLQNRQWTRLDCVPQALALDKLHHDEYLTICFIDFINSANIRMVQSGGRPRLAHEAISCFTLKCVLPGQKLYRDSTVQLKILCPVYDTHSTLAELFKYFVMRDCSADHSSLQPFDCRMYRPVSVEGIVVATRTITLT